MRRPRRAMIGGSLLAGALSMASVAVAPVAPAVSPAVAGTVIAPAAAPDGVLGSFSALGTGLSGGANVVRVVDDTVYVGGSFSSASGVDSTLRIAAWSNRDDTWHALGTGAGGTIRSIAVLDDTVYASGGFTTIGGVTTSGVAAWSIPGGSWSALGGGLQRTSFTPDGYSLAIQRDDTVFIGGAFTTAGNVANTQNIAAWSNRDDTWVALDAGNNGVNALVRAVAASDDTLYVGGSFGNAGGIAEADRMAAWRGSWAAMGTGVNVDVSALTIYRDDTLYAGGDFSSASGVPNTSGVAAWDDTWTGLGSGISFGVLGMATDDTHGLVYAGGVFTAAGGITVNYVAAWDVGIGAWVPFTWSGGVGLDAGLSSIAVDDTTVYLAGTFLNAGGDANADRIARWTWQPPQGANSIAAGVGSTVTISGEGFIGVPPTGAVKIGTTAVTTYTRTSTTSISLTVPAGSFTSSPISVYGVGGWGEVGTLTAFTVPDAPTAVSATPGNAEAEVSWSAPSDGGSAILGYTVTSSPDNVTCMTATTTCVVTGLTNGTAYTFTVTATNAIGPGASSSPSAPVTPSAPPSDAPGPPLRVTAIGGDASAAVSWSAPASSGSFPITWYQALSSPGGHSCLVSAQTTTCEVTGLTNGTAYTFEVRALNGAGWGWWSEPSDAVTPVAPFGPPGPVRDLEVVDVGADGTVTLRWRAPRGDAEAPITGYRVAHREVGTQGYVRVRPDVSGRTITVSGLTPGAGYWFRVRAGNEAGFGPGLRTESRVRIPL